MHHLISGKVLTIIIVSGKLYPGYNMLSVKKIQVSNSEYQWELLTMHHLFSEVDSWKKIKSSENSNLHLEIMDALEILQDLPHFAAWISETK